MPIGYLVTAAIVACGTWLALVPIRRPRALGVVSFLFGSLINELPFAACCYLLASTLLAAEDTGVDSVVGWVAVGLAILAGGGLVVVVRRSLRTDEAIAKALHDGLGNSWRGAIDDAGSDPRVGRPSFPRVVLGPFFFRRHDVERVANVRYGDAGRQNTLDVYRPRSRTTDGPVFIHLHGGVFVSGRKNRESRALLYRLASQGWVAISANYRLSPAARFPAHLIDVKKIIGWVREHGREYGADPAVVFVAGSSAGAHLAAMAALTPNNPTFQPGFEHLDTSVSAAVCMYGYFGSIGADERLPSSPTAYPATNAPPFFVAHGDVDTVVLVEEARLFVERLRNTSPSPVVYAELPGAQHSFDLFHSLRFEAVVDGIETFAAWVRSQKRTS